VRLGLGLVRLCATSLEVLLGQPVRHSRWDWEEQRDGGAGPGEACSGERPVRWPEAEREEDDDEGEEGSKTKTS
jgi:hypothetical protein